MDNSRSTTQKSSAFEIIASEGEKIESRICSGCGINKPLDEFSKEKLGVAGRKAKCKECVNSSYKPGVTKITSTMIQQALEAAAYRILKERLK